MNTNQHQHHHCTLMNRPFGIRFNIDNDHHSKLFANINIILAHAINNLSEYKLLDNYVPTISSLDEKKQLCMSLVACTLKKSPALIFNQQCNASKYFLIDDLYTIAVNIQFEIEKCLHNDIDAPELFICVNNL